MATPKILINGKEIENFNELPEGVQKILTDDNGNGIPDIAENPFALFGKIGDIKGLIKTMPGLTEGLPQLIQTFQQGENSVNINGKDYKNLSDIPESDKAELKAQFSQMKHLNPAENRASKPSIASMSMSAESPGAAHTLSQTPLQKRSEIPVTNSPAIQEKQDKNRVAIFILGLMALVGYVIAQYAVGA